MFKLLIIDDELLVQVGIKSMLDWEKEDIEVIGMASNGKQAYEMIEKYSPEIVITDIKMPVMDGLELMKKCKMEISYTPEFIVLTSHEDFNFAKKAIKLGAVEYLVKLELSEEVLKEAINMAKDKWNRANVITKSIHHTEVNQQEQMEKLFKNLTQLQNKPFLIKEEVALIDPQLIREPITVIICHMTIAREKELIRSEREKIYECVISTSKELMNKASYGYTLAIDPPCFCIIYQKGEDNDGVYLQRQMQKIVAINKQYFNVHLTVGISSLHIDIGYLSKAYNEAKEAMKYSCQDQELTFYREIRDRIENAYYFDIKAFVENLTKAYERGEVEKVEAIFEEIISLIKCKKLKQEEIVDSCHKIFYLIMLHFQGGEELIKEASKGCESMSEYLKTISEIQSIIEWFEYIKNGLCAYLESKGTDYTGRLVVKVQNYIAANIYEKLSLNEVAHALNISPGYLSSIFKKYHPCGFSNYVSHAKIEKAKEILLEDQLKIYEVSDLLGYKNAYYFSKVFKKVTGTTPKEYIVKN